MTKEYASVWTRFGAMIIDGLIIIPFYIPSIISVFVLESRGPNAIASDSILFINGGIIVIGLFVVLWNAIWRMGKTGQSLGRKFLNIAVLDDRGKPIGVGSAFLREIIGRFISGLFCYIGYLNAFWDKKNQMWHDKIASCYVYYVEDKFS